MKKVLVLIGATAFILSVTSFCLAESWKGTITTISGDKITVKDDTGRSRTVNISSQAFGGRGFKVGDKVFSKGDGAIHTVEGIETESDIVEYKDGEDGVNRTRPGNKSKTQKTDVSPNPNPQPARGVSTPYHKDVP
jgi:hypothetical protein